MSDDILIPSVSDGDSPDLVARWVLMCAYLYHEQDISVIDDGTFDELCAEIADTFHELSPERQNMIGDAATISHTAMDVLLSRAAIAGAHALAKAAGYEVTERPFEAEYECEITGVELRGIRG